MGQMDNSNDKIFVKCRTLTQKLSSANGTEFKLFLLVQTLQAKINYKQLKPQKSNGKTYITNAAHIIYAHTHMCLCPSIVVTWQMYFWSNENKLEYKS